MVDNIQLNTGTAGQILATHEGSSISAAGLAQYELVQLVTGSGLTKSFVTTANAFPVFLAAQASATQNVNISSISPTVNVNIASQSATLQVRIAESTSAGVNIGIVNNISATVNVNIASQSATLQVRIAESTSAGVNIGIVNNISATVNVRDTFFTAGASGTQFIHIASQSATLQVRIAESTSAGVNIGIVNNISATVNVNIASQSATLTTVLRAAGQDVSGTVNIQGSLTTTENLSSTHTVVVVSAVTFQSLVAAPGAGSAIQVFSLMVTNKSTTLTRVKFAESVTTNVRMMGDAALGGGGWSRNLKRAWTLPVNTALGAFASPAASVVVNVEYVIV